MAAAPIDRGRTQGLAPIETRNFGHKASHDAAGNSSLFGTDSAGNVLWRDTHTSLSRDQWAGMSVQQRLQILERLPDQQWQAFNQRMVGGQAANVVSPIAPTGLTGKPRATKLPIGTILEAGRPFDDRTRWFISQYQSASNPNERVRQHNANCGPTCVTMAAEAFGRIAPVPARASSNIMQTRYRTGDARSAVEPTTPEGLARAARSYGLKATVVENVTLHKIHQTLAADGLAIVLVRPSYLFPGAHTGHYTVVTAIMNGRVYLNDPAHPTGPISITVGQFERALAQRGAYRMVSVGAR
jgi:hypothetical protein